jgi:hypothetical protein
MKRDEGNRKTVCTHSEEICYGCPEESLRVRMPWGGGTGYCIWQFTITQFYKSISRD